MKWRDAEGKPLEPNWADSILPKTMEDVQDFDAVATALEVAPTAEGGFQGPSVKVGGENFEAIQVSLPMFGSIADDLQEDVERAVYLQRSPKDRLLDLKVDERLLAEKIAEDKRDWMDKSLKKAMRGRQVAAYLKTWSSAKRKDIEANGISREELLEGLVPAVGAASRRKDPALKALEDFLKLHKHMQVAGGRAGSGWHRLAIITPPSRCYYSWPAPRKATPLPPSILTLKSSFFEKEI